MMLAKSEHFWKPNNGFQHSETVDGVLQQWRHQHESHVPCENAGFYEHGMQVLVHHWRKCIVNGGEYVKKNRCSVAENLLYLIVLLCIFLICSISMEINTLK